MLFKLTRVTVAQALTHPTACLTAHRSLPNSRPSPNPSSIQACIMTRTCVAVLTQRGTFTNNSHRGLRPECEARLSTCANRKAAERTPLCVISAVHAILPFRDLPRVTAVWEPCSRSRLAAGTPRQRRQHQNGHPNYAVPLLPTQGCFTLKIT